MVSTPRLDVGSDGTKETYGRGQPILVDVTWASPVTWDVSATGAAIGVSLDVGGTARTAALVTGGATSGTASTLRFSYTVAQGDADTDGIALTAAAGGTLVTVSGGATLVGEGTSSPAGRVHAGLGNQAGHLADGAKQAPANAAPTCAGSAAPSDPPLASPPGQDTAHNGLLCSDADGDTLELTVSVEPASMADSVSYDSTSGRVVFKTPAICALAAVTPALTSPFTTTFTVTVTDPEGATGTGQARFTTAFGTCVTQESAGLRDATVTLLFTSDLDENSVPAAGDFEVKVDGTVVPLAPSGAVAVDGNEVRVTLARAPDADQAVDAELHPGHQSAPGHRHARSRSARLRRPPDSTPARGDQRGAGVDADG